MIIADLTLSPTGYNGAVEKPNVNDLRLLRFARNDIETRFLSLRGAKRRSNLDFFNSPIMPFFIAIWPYIRYNGVCIIVAGQKVWL